MLDILIKNGQIIDGSGMARFPADVAVENGRVVEIGLLPDAQASRIIDASGCVISPGFIDIHSHADLTLPFGPSADSLVHQGITTAVVGQCGLSPAPLAEKTREQVTTAMDAWVAQMAPKLPMPWEQWSTFGDFLNYLTHIGISMNIVPLVGQGMIRATVMGYGGGPANAAQKERMRAEVVRAMSEGAAGISTGLIYPPGSYANTEELIDLTRPVGERDGFYFSHLRAEGSGLLDALAEAVRIGREVGIPVQVSHFKATGKANWDKLPRAISMLEQAQAEGLDITADTYPYLVGSTTLLSLLPEWAQEGGKEATLERLADPVIRREMAHSMQKSGGYRDVDWDDVMVSSCPSRPEYQGRRVHELAEVCSKSPHQVVFDVLLETELEASMFLFQIAEDNLITKLRHPAVMIGTDSFGFAAEGPRRQGVPHPRNYGVYPRLLGRYVREKAVISLEEALWKTCGFPAQKLRLPDRGLLKKSYAADLVVFDPDTIIDRATFEEPHQYPEGIAYVIVNGQVVVQENVHTQSRPGSIL